MPTFRLEISREVIYWESAYIEVKANNLEDAKKIALEDARKGEYMEDFKTDDFPTVNYEIFEVEE